MERELIEPDLKQLDHDRDLRAQQIKDRIKKVDEHQKDIQEMVDEIQKKIKVENQNIEEQVSKEEFYKAEDFRTKLEAGIGKVKEILHEYIDEKNAKEKNIENIYKEINKLSGAGIEQFEKLDID